MVAGEKIATDGSNARAANQCLVAKPKKRAFVPKRPPKPARKFWAAPTGEKFQDTINKMTTQLMGWMVEREKVAIKRNEFKLDWEEWSDDPIMLIFRFCNVRRECDRVTRAVIDNLKGLNEMYIKNPTNTNAERIIVSLLVWRFVGSEAFVRRVGPIDSSLFEGEPGNLEEERVVRIMMEVSETTFCFTDAYRPAQFLRNVEKKYKKDPISRENLYRSMFRRSTVGLGEDQFKSIHKMFQMDRLSIAAEKAREMVHVLKTKKSFASLGEILQSIPGMGRQTPFTFVEGSRNPLVKRVSGFGAKEVLQDLQLTPLAEYDNMVDKHEYCPIGPGAAKGIRMLLDDEIQPDEEILYKDMHHILRKLYKHVQERFPGKILGVPQKTITLHEVQSALCETSKYLCLAGTGKARHRRYQCADADEDTAKRVTLLFFKNIEYRRDAAFFDFGSEEKRADLFARVRDDRPYDPELASVNRAKAQERALQEKKRKAAARVATATSVLRSRSEGGGTGTQTQKNSIAQAAMRAANRADNRRAGSARSLGTFSSSGAATGGAKMEQKWLEACASSGLSPSAFHPLDRHIFFVHYRRKMEQRHVIHKARSDPSLRELRSRSLEPLFDETRRRGAWKEEERKTGRRAKSVPAYWESSYHRGIVAGGRKLRGRTRVFSNPSTRGGAIRALKEMYLPGSEELKEQRAKRAAYARERRKLRKEELRMEETPSSAVPAAVAGGGGVLLSSSCVQVSTNNQYIKRDGVYHQVMMPSSKVVEEGNSTPTRKGGGNNNMTSNSSPVSKTTTASIRKSEKRKDKRVRKQKAVDAEERDRENAEASCLLKDIMDVREENEKSINSVLDMCESSSLYPPHGVSPHGHNVATEPHHGDFAPPIPGFVHPMPPPKPHYHHQQVYTPHMVSSHNNNYHHSSIPKQYAIKAPTEMSTSLVLYKGPNCLLSDSFESVTARSKKRRGAIVLPSEPDDEVQGMLEDSDKTQHTKLALGAKKTRRRTRSTSGAENHMLVPVNQATSDHAMNGNYGRPTSTYNHHLGAQDEAPSSRATACWAPAPGPDHPGLQQGMDTNASIPMLALMNDAPPVEKPKRTRRRTRTPHTSAPPTTESNEFCPPMVGGEPQPSSPYYFPHAAGEISPMHWQPGGDIMHPSGTAEEMPLEGNISPSALHSTPITPSESIVTNRGRRTKSRKKQRLGVSAEQVCMTNNEIGVNGNTNTGHEEMAALMVAHSDEHKHDGSESGTRKSKKSRATPRHEEKAALMVAHGDEHKHDGSESGTRKSKKSRAATPRHEETAALMVAHGDEHKHDGSESGTPKSLKRRATPRHEEMEALMVAHGDEIKHHGSESGTPKSLKRRATPRHEETEALMVSHSDEHKHDGAESSTPKSKKSRASGKSKKIRAASSVVDDEVMGASGVLEDGVEKDDEPIVKVLSEEEMDGAMKELLDLLKVRKLKGDPKPFSVTDTAVKRRKAKLEEKLKEEEEKLKQVLEEHNDTMTVERKELLTWVHARRVKAKISEIQRDLDNSTRDQRRRERERMRRRLKNLESDKIKGTSRSMVGENEARSIRGGTETGTTKTRRPRVALSSPGNSKRRARHQAESARSSSRAMSHQVSSTRSSSRAISHQGESSTRRIKRASSLPVDRKSSSPERRAQRALASPERKTKQKEEGGEHVRALSVESFPSLPPVEEKTKKPVLVFKSDNSPKETKNENDVALPLKRVERKASVMRTGEKKARLPKKVFKPGVNSPKKTKVVLSLKRDLMMNKAKVVLPLKRVRKPSAMKEKRGRPMKVFSPKKTKSDLSSKMGPDNSPKKTEISLSSKMGRGNSPKKTRLSISSKRGPDNSPKKTKFTLSSKRDADNSPKKTKFNLSSRRTIPSTKAKVVLPLKRVQRKASAMKEKRGRPMKGFKSDNYSPKKTKEVKKNVAMMKKKTKKSEETKAFCKHNASTKTSVKSMKKRNDRNDTNNSRRKAPKKENNRPERKNGKEKKKLHPPLVMKKGVKDIVNILNGRNKTGGSSILRRAATLSIRRDTGSRLKINRDQDSSPRSKKSSSSKPSMNRTSSGRFA